jgi:hypothetical protein
MNIDFSEIPPLDKPGLRKFGLTTGLIFAGLFGALLPWLWRHPLPRWPWVLGAVLCSLALVTPRSLNPFYQLWMRLALVLGWINSRLLLGLIFILVVIPMALVLKVLRKDPMQRKLEPESSSYRLMKRSASDDSMTTPY